MASDKFNETGKCQKKCNSSKLPNISVCCGTFHWKYLFSFLYYCSIVTLLDNKYYTIVTNIRVDTLELY